MLDMEQKPAYWQEKMEQGAFEEQTMAWLQSQQLPELSADTQVLAQLSWGHYEDGTLEGAEFGRRGYAFSWGKIVREE